MNKTAKELYGIDNFTDMIGDETNHNRSRRRLLHSLTEHNHPALVNGPDDVVYYMR